MNPAALLHGLLLSETAAFTVVDIARPQDKFHQIPHRNSDIQDFFFRFHMPPPLSLRINRIFEIRLAFHALAILKHLKSAHFSTKNGYFSVFCGSISHALSCKHETHDLLTLVSSS